jgi:hypothetical protein
MLKYHRDIVLPDKLLISHDKVHRLKNVAHLFVVKKRPSNAGNLLSAKNEYFERVKRFPEQ